MTTNWRFFFLIVAFAFCLAVLVGLATAEDNETVLNGINISAFNESTVIILNGPGDPPAIPPRIEQGSCKFDKNLSKWVGVSCVYINDTVDVSGVSGWPGPDGEYRLAYYGRYADAPSPDGLIPTYIVTLPGKRHLNGSASQYWYWIDPDIYAPRIGWWFQFMTNVSDAEENGNLRAFYVVNDFRTVFNATSNETEINYVNGTYNESVFLKPEPLLPERHVADYVVARGDPIEWPPGGYHLWLFGKDKGYYDLRENIISRDQVSALPEGDYILAVHSAGTNTIYECKYDDVNRTLLPGLYGKQPVDVRGMDPMTIRQRFLTMLADSDDTVDEYKIVVQEPSITINRADEIPHNGTDVFDVRGYTNAANGTEVNVVLDDGKSYIDYIKKRTIKTVAIRTSPGNLSYYRAYVPFEYEELAADAFNHTLTASALGVKAERGFKISRMPPDSCKYPEAGGCHTNASLKWTSEFNPFQENMTRVTVTVTVPVIREVVVHDTPSQAQVDEAQRKALDLKVQDLIAGAVFWGLVILVGYLILRFAYRVYMRRRWHKP